MMIVKNIVNIHPSFYFWRKLGAVTIVRTTWTARTGQFMNKQSGRKY